MENNVVFLTILKLTKLFQIACYCKHLSSFCLSQSFPLFYLCLLFWLVFSSSYFGVKPLTCSYIQNNISKVYIQNNSLPFWIQAVNQSWFCGFGNWMKYDSEAKLNRLQQKKQTNKQQVCPSVTNKVSSHPPFTPNHRSPVNW